MLMYVTRVPNRGSPPAILLRESYRDGDKVKTRTLANLSRWPEAKIEALRRVLKGAAVAVPERLTIERSLPHGHVAAVLGMARKLGLERLVRRRPERLAKLALALIVARVLEPAAKLATARQLSAASAAHSLGAVLGLGAVDEDELYRALDLLGEAQPKIEAALARRHLRNGCLVLYDLTSSWLEGRCCELARFGYSRDGRRDKLQIVFGLLCRRRLPDRGAGVRGRYRRPEHPRRADRQAQAALRAAARGAGGRPGDDHQCPDRAGPEARRPRLDHRPAGAAIQALAAENGPCSRRRSISATWPRSPRRAYPGERGGVEPRSGRRAGAQAAVSWRDERKLARSRPHRVSAARSAADANALKVGAALGRRKMAKRFRLPSPMTA